MHMPKIHTERSMRSVIIAYSLLLSLPMAILLIWLNIHTLTDFQRRVFDARRSTLSVHAENTDKLLESVDRQIIRSLRDNTLPLNVLRSTDDEVEYILTRCGLIGMLNSCAEQFPNAAVFFLYLEEQDDYIPVARPGSLSFSAKDELRAYVTAGEPENAAFAWHSVLLDGECHLFKMFRTTGVRMGVCMEASLLTAPLTSLRILDAVNLTVESDSGLSYTLPPDGGRPKRSDELISVSSQTGGYTLTLRIRRATVLESLPLLPALVFLLTLITLLLAVMLIFRVSRVLTSPVEQLIRAMEKLRGGDLDSQVTLDGFSEIRALQITFNDMSQEIRNLKISVYEEQLSLQQTQLHYAQEQAKPHFYLNCLNIIYNLSAKGDLEKIRLVTGKLMEYFRFILKSDQRLVTLAEEIESIRSFIELQKIRYPSGFTYEEQLCLDSSAVHIPPMLLLPVVENCFKYALSMDSDTLITLETGTRPDGTGCIFRVSDSGNGFPQEILQQFREGEPLLQQGRTCIGLTNIRQRMNLTYGAGAVMKLKNIKPHGACVEITVKQAEKEEFCCIGY